MKILGRKVHHFIPSNVLNHILSKKNTISGQSQAKHVLLNYTVSYLSRVAVKYILVCYDIFSRNINLYLLKAAKPKTCSKKISNHFVEVIKILCR